MAIASTVNKYTPSIASAEKAKLKVRRATMPSPNAAVQRRSSTKKSGTWLFRAVRTSISAKGN